MRALFSSHQVSCRILKSLSQHMQVKPMSASLIRVYSSQNASDPPNNTSRTNPYKSYYQGFGRPVVFNLLVAMATFQAVYWSWLKLESIEEQRNKLQELQSLERDLKGLMHRQPTD